MNKRIKIMNNRNNRPAIEMQLSRKTTRRSILSICLFLTLSVLNAQTPELETAVVKVGQVWVGVKANGDKGNFDYRAGFFPNDYDILGVRGQQWDTWGGAGFRLATTNWDDPLIADSVHTVAIYGPTNDFLPTGKVVAGHELTNYVRYGYPAQTIDAEDYTQDDIGTVNPDAFGDLSCDQLVEVTSENILGVQLNRRVMAWSQNYHDDYVIVDVEFTNVNDDTLFNFYINIQSNGDNTFRSNGSNPPLSSGDRYDNATTWQHYYGGRTGDSLRVFYEYGADEPDIPGDNMGAPVLSQNGRLINSKFAWYSILHASQAPYLDPALDQDDFIQPRVTYVGKDNLIPNAESGSDEYGNNNFWAIRGGYSRFFPMEGDTIPGTFHGGNTDELGVSDYSDYPAGTKQNGNSKMWSSFGPYTFPPGYKIRIALANGWSGLDMEASKEIGAAWLAGTLTEAPDLPDARSGYFPANFEFPPDATSMDKIKDRWLSTCVDSVMQSASRAKWNFDRGYQIPAAPPPPSYVEITGLGTGVEIKWVDLEAEDRSDFAGYRIMRKLSNADTTFYQTIYSSDANDKASEHIYVDDQVLIGAQYYYYIQTKALIDTNDPDAYPALRGKISYSNRVLHPNVKWINPPHFSQNDLNKIAIVPNPYNINDPLLAEQGWTDRRGIQFYNLPAQLKIRIYTENGDLVQTLDHDSPVSAGYVFWDMVTSNQQIINSGLYIAVFETPAGEISYQKFAVIR